MPHCRRERGVHQLSRLAEAGGKCHGAGMNGIRKSAPRGGGAIIASAIIAGVIGGIIAGQPSMGFLAGAGMGVLIALLLWLKDRRRR